MLSFRKNAYICLEEWQRALDDFATSDQLDQSSGRRREMNQDELADRAKCYAGIGQLENAIPLFSRSLENRYSSLVDDQFAAFNRVIVNDDQLASVISLAQRYHKVLTRLERSSEIEQVQRRLSEVIRLIMDN